MRRTTGSVKKLKIKSPLKWQVRMTYQSPDTGARVDIKRRFETEGEARRELWDLLLKHRQKGTVEKTIKQMTLAEAAKKYEEEKLFPAVMRDGKHLAGRHETSAPKSHLKAIVASLGKKKVKAINYSDLERFRMARLHTPTRNSGLRSARTINAELQQLNALLNYCQRNGWIEKNPFNEGEPLIVKEAENKRDRVLSLAEEQRLLDVCVNERAHLRPLIVAALETGLRRGILFSLQWDQIDFVTGYIKLGKPKTKRKGHPEEIKMTPLLQAELEAWQKYIPPMQVSVFGIEDNIKRAWATACRLASIENLHFHDLRHSFATRAIAAGMSPTELIKATGHSSLTMLSRYVNPENAAIKVATALEQFRTQQRDDLFSTDSMLIN